MQLAAVDLGSNSFRLEIGRVEGNHIARVGYWKETVRLAAGLGEDGRLVGKAIAVAVDTLARMNELLRGIPPGNVRAVGTQALRLARNVDEFLLAAQDALGYPIEVISGREEARLIFEGCAHQLPLTDQPRLVVDVGGASTELIVGAGFTASSAESYKVGCVNTSLRFFPDGRIDRASLRRAQVAAAAEFEEAIAFFGRDNWSEAFGSSGTIGALSGILRAEGWTDGTLTVDALQRLREALLDAGDVGRIALAGVKPDRQAVIPGGLAVVSAVFETLGITEMRTARGGLRVGVLYDLLGRRGHKDVRHSTVERVMTRFGVDRQHAARVCELALALHAVLEPQAPEEATNHLHWAALLHEVGFAISHGDYHKHSAYLVLNADLPGFSTTDQERIAVLVLGQRGNLRKVAHVLPDRERAAKLLALRLAVILAHARRDVQLPHLALRFHEAIDFSIDGDWLADHPLTHHLLEEEAGRWERAGVHFRLRTR